jgi:anti-sigma factor ChrR (cupin superfamily)
VTRVRANLNERAVVNTQHEPWVASPELGVERLLLERDGGELARATSLVRYAPKSFFAAHVHPQGEEFLVLQGTFSDEFGDYSAGTYVRSPWNSQHRPFSKQGCVIFVKVRQIPERDTNPVHIQNATGCCILGEGQQQRELLLHEFEGERTSLLRLNANARSEFPSGKRREIFVVEGSVSDGAHLYHRLTWLRIPRDETWHFVAQTECLLFVKT